MSLLYEDTFARDDSFDEGKLLHKGTILHGVSFALKVISPERTFSQGVNFVRGDIFARRVTIARGDTFVRQNFWHVESSNILQFTLVVFIILIK